MSHPSPGSTRFLLDMDHPSRSIKNPAAPSSTLTDKSANQNPGQATLGETRRCGFSPFSTDVHVADTSFCIYLRCSHPSISIPIRCESVRHTPWEKGTHAAFRFADRKFYDRLQRQNRSSSFNCYHRSDTPTSCRLCPCSSSNLSVPVSHFGPRSTRARRISRAATRRRGS